MGGRSIDEEIAILGEWLPPNGSPRSFLSSSMISGDAMECSGAYSGSENTQGPQYLVTQGQGSMSQNTAQKDSAGAYESREIKMLAEPKIGLRGCLRERMAARAGFRAPKLNTENIKPVDLSKNSEEVRSPYLTIPPGLSPTCLLDSPVFLANSLAVPSPTTGKLTSTAGINNNQNSSPFEIDDPRKGKENNAFEDASLFAFKLIAESPSTPQSNVANVVHSSRFSVPSETSLLHQNVKPSNFQAFPKIEEENRVSNFSSGKMASVGVTENSPPLDVDDGDQRNSGGSNADDGYNWRKYGQKQVKGSEFPRSYYKCTYSNCPVKKKVERSHEGHITEIIYKGTHIHSKPNLRSGLGSSNTLLDSEAGTGIGSNGDMIWSSKVTVAGGPGWVQESSAPLGQEYSNGATFQVQNVPHHEPGDGVDHSLTFSNEDEDDRVTHGSVSLVYDGEGDESESKRRRSDAYPTEMTGATRSMREPRIVVQTVSDVDILDDGYRWRKYGQKVVKGNPNPRSYYKCTSSGCNVRKHVERASHDLKSVITTYEGKHNHVVPAARNSSHNTSAGNSNGLPSQQPPATCAVVHHLNSHFNTHRHDPLHIHSQFERPHLGPGFRLSTNHPGLPTMGHAIIHQGKFPVLPLHPPLNPYLGHHRHHQGINGMGTGMGMGFVVPKAEPKLEPGIEPKNGASAAYQHLMNQMHHLEPHT